MQIQIQISGTCKYFSVFFLLLSWYKNVDFSRITNNQYSKLKAKIMGFQIKIISISSLNYIKKHINCLITVREHPSWSPVGFMLLNI
jgi:hypothetical protein